MGETETRRGREIRTSGYQKIRMKDIRVSEDQDGGKGSFEVRKLGRWKRGEKFQMVNEVPNPKNADNKKTRRPGDKVTRR